MSHPRDVLCGFTAATQHWFTSSFAEPTVAQVGAWQAIAEDRHTLVVAPTGSGKTLAAFLWSIDQLICHPAPVDRERRCQIVYVSPLKALAADVERNLRVPLTGIRQAAAKLGSATREVEIAMRTGDTPAADRRRFATRPADILITTPESLFLVLTSAARAGLAGVQTVIVDEIHAVAGSKRGAHLAVTLERLDDFLVSTGGRPARRVGLSATVHPPQTVADFLSGHRSLAEGGRTTALVRAPSTKQVVVEIAVPVPDLSDLGAGHEPNPEELLAPSARRRASIWPHVEERVVDLVAGHRSTLVFTNSRRSAERLTARMNEIWADRHQLSVPDPATMWPAQTAGLSGSAGGADPVLARAHHGSMSRAERTATEQQLKDGLLPAVVATSTLELGIDMGLVDLVALVGTPPSVSSGLQRIGRAGHRVGAVSRGVLLPTHRADLVCAAVLAARMRSGQIEELHLTVNPLDILAQQIVAMVALEPLTVEQVAATVRRSAPFGELSDGLLHGVLDMLAGRYPSEDFGELRARIVWDRSSGVLTARPGAQRLAVTSGGTIPDRGQFGVYLSTQDSESPDRQRGGKRVGELDEEMVYESRVGETFTLGSSTWRIEEITPDRVLVSPAPGLPGRLPFWKGDSPGRPAELGRAIGRWVRQTTSVAASEPSAARAALIDQGLDAWACDNVLSYLLEQRAATGQLPDDRTILVERFRDELGDWRVVVHSPLGARVHAPWALIIAGRLQERLGVDVSCMHSDDGIVFRLPDAQDWDSTAGGLTLDDVIVDPQDVSETVRSALGGSVMFAARFREAAARSLLLPRRRPDRRQPLWQQRHRAAQLLSVAAQFPEFPIVLEAARECLHDVFDIAALQTLMGEIAAGKVQIIEVTTPAPSPFATSLLFGYTAAFLYDGDAPLAERRAAALSLDPTLLSELLGSETVGELADLLDPEAIERAEAQLARRAGPRQARSAEELWDVLHTLGPLPSIQLVHRCVPQAPVAQWLATLQSSHRILEVHLSGASDPDQWIVVEDAARLRDALGVNLPAGLPASHLEPVADPLGDLVRRHGRSHGPFHAEDLTVRFGLGIAAVQEILARLVAQGIMTRGRLRPESIGGRGEQWCDVQVLRMLRRQSLAALRAEVEAVPGPTLGTFLPRWHGVGEGRGVPGVLRAVEQLAGVVLPASVWETLVLPARIADYSPALLDEATASGEVIWRAHAGAEGLISMHLAQWAPLTLAAPDPVHDELPQLVLAALGELGAQFLVQIAASTGIATDHVLDALWTLVWSGHVTNDGFGPIRVAAADAHRVPLTTAQPRALRSRMPAWQMARPAVRTPTDRSPRGAGRWSVLPPVDSDPTRRAHALTQVLLARHGVVTRAIARSEGVSGQFRTVYQVLREAEDAGSVRRGYFVEHLGGAQFALPGAVDLLRTSDQERSRDRAAGRPVSLLLAASDPANPYGAALNWPDGPVDRAGVAHRPGRKAGAMVILVDGELALYIERGGRTVLTFIEGPALNAACGELARYARSVRSGRLTIAQIDGVVALEAAAHGSADPRASALLSAGFRPTPQGLRIS